MNCAARAERGIPSTDRMGAVEGIYVLFEYLEDVDLIPR